ncbi:MAG TPA: hypothetical protein VJ894_08100, partial [Cryomorphaceae bacterium]|nr:hypothetical protein [Cryomorphaceae bacterium]
MMLTILTKTELRESVEHAIASIDRLHELVRVVSQTDEVTDLKTLVVGADQISIPFDWYDSEPPYAIPKVSFSEENLLALVFLKLGNHQKAFEFVEEGSALFHHLLIATHLQFGYEITDEMLAFAKETSPHNNAVAKYYGQLSNAHHHQDLKEAFTAAIKEAENDEIRIFSLKHYLNLLLDIGSIEEAKKLIEDYSKLAISEDAKFALDLQLTAILKEELRLPYQAESLNQILDLQLAGIDTYES